MKQSSSNRPKKKPKKTKTEKTTIEIGESTVVIGIDNGVTGGICALSPFSGEVIECAPIPVLRNGDKKELDVPSLLSWLSKYSANMVVGVEEPLKHAGSSQAMRSMSITFGQIHGACIARGYAIHRIGVTEWQKEILGKVPVGHTKAYALIRAGLLWPEQKWLATSRCSTPHDGIVDAALIAAFMLRCRV